MATRNITRIAIIITTLLFFVSAFGLTGLAIWSQAHDNSSNTNNSTSTSCQQDVATEATLPVPAAYSTPTVTQLQITDLTVGSGAAAKAGDCLVVKYDGMLASTGAVFQEDFDQPSGFSFTLGAGQVIAGWDQGLVGLKAGGTRRLVIPAALGYGANPPSGSGIPANANLVFVIKLLRIQ